MIHVRSRKFFLDLLNNDIISFKCSAVISIYSSLPERVITEPKATFLNSIGCDHLSLCFKDVSVEGFPGLITEEQAIEIVAFLKKFSHKKKLLIHCDAGISRSGAVGFFACRYYGLDELEFIKNNPYIYPNPYVFNLLYTVSGMKEAEDDLNPFPSCDMREKIIGLFSKRHQGYKQADDQSQKDGTY